MEAKASVTDVHSTPKKLRILLAHIKKMSPVKAMDHLFYSPKKSATILYKVIKSAVDNAKATLQIDAHLLEFKLLKVDQGHALRRYNPGSRGTSKPYRKQFAHIQVVVGLKSQPQKIETEKKQEVQEPKKILKVAKKPVQKKKTAAQTK
ncbi:50S ribosomal protein L22 [Candidatus Roizmanbacteria bacterium CG_4_10_14_3_um_filter_39_13]|uniref:50S ribosomal protein L22 n=3 Tax=Candidatus Roizmaniibacteriota TaxID=1752723 RepID=A0A2H0KKV5_9BACT|nr:MAG: 50S ribosomal protein L22 [Candidatus Roizmanbacteria bacterium CG11_big_fil_rev_8_21_14_0_20_37_16]PIV71308.1 MAG: 50S ribosomal protein L22 [Candidatus Roizmanbacteria bacterium CG17_big_fil_post_rev_8_21_14_2_50_39_7]PIX68633.1 MAG: 50S ribosomal protein L22 [Candidatus Roizmanbacteria bacterium CG_4_10_14_3_um_filter_39_13]